MARASSHRFPRARAVFLPAILLLPLKMFSEHHRGPWGGAPCVYVPSNSPYGGDT
ncbi:hypothetical protein B0H13DRAFT_2300640 [Mycena leptocephala]|nr:hypothetical protein B0H13DRAFT_2300640 [Mycena leptocephala]